MADADYDLEEWLERYAVEAQDMSEHGEDNEDNDNEGDSDLDNDKDKDKNSEDGKLGAGDDVTFSSSITLKPLNFLHKP